VSAANPLTRYHSRHSQLSHDQRSRIKDQGLGSFVRMQSLVVYSFVPCIVEQCFSVPSLMFVTPSVLLSNTFFLQSGLVWGYKQRNLTRRCRLAISQWKLALRACDGKRQGTDQSVHYPTTQLPHL
jgi:hypothetical protein